MIGTSLEEIIPSLPYLLAAVIILVLVFAYLLFLILRGTKGKAPPPVSERSRIEPDQAGDGAEEEEVRARALRFPVLNLRRSFARAVALMRANVAGRDYRYRIPWFLMIGESGAGKTTALDSANLNLSFGKSLVEKRRGTQLCNWWFFDKGMVLDVAGDMVSHKGGKTPYAKTWPTFLRLLHKHRPERPIDGVILTIPADDLLGPEGDVSATAEKAVQKASVLYERLWEIQRKLGIRFPLYVLVTKCDLIEGFRSFARVLPERLRNQIFGWSTPFPVGSGYTHEWVEEAFRTLQKDLHQTQMAAFTEGVDPAEGDGLFLFPQKFRSIAEPLQACLDRVFRDSAYHESFTLRGIYFCGDGGTDPSDTARKRPSFVKDLFEKKIFPEFALGRPVTKHFISWNRAVFAAQALALSVALIWGAGLWWSCRTFQEDKGGLMPVLENIDKGLRTLKTRQKVDSAFFHTEALHLMEGMGRSRYSDLNYLFIPSSYFDNIEKRLEQAIYVAYDNILMKSLSLELHNRVRRIIASEGAAPARRVKSQEPMALEETPEFVSLQKYVDDIAEFERVAAKYENVRTGGGEEAVRDLSMTVKYLFGTDLPRDFSQFAKHYNKTLGTAIGEPLNLRLYEQDATSKAERLTGNLYERVFKSNAIAAYLRILVIQLENFGRKSRSAAKDAKLIRDLLDTMNRAELLLSDPDLAWVGKEFQDLGTPFLRVLATIGESRLIHRDLRTRLEKVGEAHYRELRQDLKQIRTALTGPLLQWEDGGIRLAFSSGVVELRNDLQTLLSQEFMVMEPAERETIRIPAGARVLWDIKSLEDAVKAVDPYETFIRHGLKSFPTDLRNTIKNTAQNTFNLNMLQLIARAQNLRPVSSRFSFRPTEADVRLEVENFREASKHLDRLIFAFERLEVVEAYQDLVQIVNWQASTLLDAVDKLFSAEAFYAVKGGDLSWWDGKEPLALASFDVNDDEELKYYLELQRDRIKYLAYQYAEPILAFYTARPIPRDRASTHVFSRWERILSALDKFESRKPKNPVTILERFILFDLNKIRSDNYLEKISQKEISQRSGDYFLEVQGQLMRMVYEQGRSLNAKQVSGAYASIQSFFNERLAGRFPFAPLEDRGRVDAEPQDVVAFFRLLERHPKLEEEIMSLDGFFVPSAAIRASEFLRQVKAIGGFFSPFLGSGEKDKGRERDHEKTPLFDFSMEFRVNQQFEIAGNQIIEWKMTVAGQEFTHLGGKDTGRWRFGDPVRLWLRWAKDSPDYPIKDRDTPGLTVADRTVLYEYTDRWSLVELLRRHRGAPEDFEGLVDPKPHTLKFEIATRVGGSMAEEKYKTKVFIRMTPLSPEEKEKQVLFMPSNFPETAPGLVLLEELRKNEKKAERAK